MPPDVTWLALDIGGANIKAADGRGYARSMPFPLWRNRKRLTEVIGEMLASSPPHQQLAITMTGELADCFATKTEGVRAILDAVEQVANSPVLSVYQTDGRLVAVEVARQQPLLAAASNWHALAQYACRFCKGQRGLLIDIGSTTCDIIPLDGEKPIAIGHTDPERLVAGELVYTGIGRSPLCGVVRELPWRTSMCPVAQELFSTTADAYVLLEDLPEDAEDLATADGRPRTKPYAHARLARAICADVTMVSREDAKRAAGAVRDRQLELLAKAAGRVLARLDGPAQRVVLSGHGEFLARQLLAKLQVAAEIVSLEEQLGVKISRCGPAHALAALARENAF